MLALFSVNTYAVSRIASCGAKKISWLRSRVNLSVALGPAQSWSHSSVVGGGFSPYHISYGDLRPRFEAVVVRLTHITRNCVLWATEEQ